MNKNTIFLAILAIFLVSLSAGSVFAEDVSNDTYTISQASDYEIAESNSDVNDVAYVSNEISENNEYEQDVADSKVYNISAGSNSSTIQGVINQMGNGDVLNFENGTYNDICIYVDKNITVNGNGATLNGYSNPGVNNSNIPDVIKNTTKNGGYAISNFATFYVVNTTNAVINGLTVVGLNSTTYSNAALYATLNTNLTLINNTIIGSSWGIYSNSNPNVNILNNLVKNQATTGILSFGSLRAIIKNNTVINATNHGIDVRHGTGNYAQVLNNTVIGSKEGIYLMHSKYHIAANNTLINNTISGVTCYGSSNVTVEDNNFTGGRLAVLLGGGFANITIGENSYDLANLPFPPTFVYYVGIANSPYQSTDSSQGTYSDITYNVTYTKNYTIPEVSIKDIDYSALVKPTGVTYTVPEGTSSENIQKMIDSMSDGDTLSFEKGAVYENISIYTDKNIKILGNGATLKGYTGAAAINKTNVPSKVMDTTTAGGYAVPYYSVLYVLNNSNVVISDLNIVGGADGYDDNTVGSATDTYKTVDLYAEKSQNLTILNCNISGNSWGINLQYCDDAVISNNSIEDVYTTGILSFGSKTNLIVNNTITNAINHGIDVRHGSGNNATVVNNTISGSKEGIYLMHSKNHMVFNNTILNGKISGITAYGSGNEYIFNNTIKGSRIGVILGSGYYNVTLSNNAYSLDYLPFPPTFVSYVVTVNSPYQSSENVIGTYSDSSINAVIIVDDVVIEGQGNVSAILKDSNGNNLANENLTFTINGVNTTVLTNANGVATVPVSGLASGNYTVRVSFAGNEELESHYEEFNLEVIAGNTVIKADDISLYYKNGTKLSFTLLYNGNALANQTVTITLNGVNYTRTTDENGSASMSINLGPGKYNAVISYNGTDVYDPAKEEVSVEVLTTVITEDMVKYYKNGTQYYVQLLDGQGNPLANTNVTLNINGVLYVRTTNASGFAKLNINLNPGNYTITASYDGLSMSSNIEVLPTIESSDLVKYFRNGSQYFVKVIDGQGNPLSNVTVALNINGVLYNRTTNASGFAKLNINLNPGNYTITASYDGLSMSSNIEVLPTIESSDLVKYFRNGSQFFVKVIDGQGNPLSNSTVTFNINGVFYTKTTNASGFAKLNINLNPGNYIISSTANGCTVSNDVTVLPILETQDISMTTSSRKAFTATALSDTGAPVANVNVTFNVNGVFYNRTTNENGVASLNINLNPGDYIISSTYKGCTVANNIAITEASEVAQATAVANQKSSYGSGTSSSGVYYNEYGFAELY